MNFKSSTIFIFIIFLCTGCIKREPKVFVFTKKKGVLKTAILPFKNNSQNLTVARKIYRILLTKLIQDKRFSPIEEGEIRNFMIKHNIYPGDFLNLRQLQELKKITKADIIVGGNVLEANTKQGDVKITLILWARDTYTGKLLCTIYYVKTGSEYRKIMHFGKIFTISELATKMVNEIVTSWDNKNLY